MTDTTEKNNNTDKIEHDKGFHLFLVRHGESANNALPDYQRVPDPALTELGQQQAEDLASTYQHLPRIDHIIVSPFRRTLQTAWPLLEARNCRATIWADIYEVGGCYSGHEHGKLIGEPGMTHSQIAEEFPRYDIPPEIDEQGWYKGRAYETWDQADSRAQIQAQRMQDRFCGRDVVVVCVIHADFKQLLLQKLLPVQPEYHGPGLPNTSVTHLHFNSADKSASVDNAGVQVPIYADVSHLRDTAVSY